MSALPHDDRQPVRLPLHRPVRRQYDDWFAASNTDATVGVPGPIAEEGPPGPLLELGSGTGRVALPLTRWD